MVAAEWDRPDRFDHAVSHRVETVEVADGRVGVAHPQLDPVADPGALRLVNRQLAGQASWLLPLALLGLATAACPGLTARQRQALLFWGGWLVPQLVFFSVANLFHRYYLVMLAPAVAALAASGVAGLWAAYGRPVWRGWGLPLALAASALGEVAILYMWPEWSAWLAPLTLGLALGAAGVLAGLRLAADPGARGRRAARVATAVGAMALLVAPAVWSATALVRGGDAALPFAGPELVRLPRGGGLAESGRLVAYLQAERRDEAFLVAAPNAGMAAPIILATGQPVMALGGFSGGDRLLTVPDLERRVAEGQVRFFLLSPDGGMQGELARWVRRRCELVPRERWQEPSPPGAPRPAAPGVGLELWDCARCRRVAQVAQREIGP